MNDLCGFVVKTISPEVELPDVEAFREGFRDVVDFQYGNSARPEAHLAVGSYGMVWKNTFFNAIPFYMIDLREKGGTVSFFSGAGV